MSGSTPMSKMERLVQLARSMRSYQEALKILNSSRRGTRPDWNAIEIPNSRSKRPSTPGLRGTPSLSGMTQWLRILGHTSNDVNDLNVVHIAGTKGKGSTCAFTEAFLRTHGRRTGFPVKTGLYTSPHLMVPEERIRIDSSPLSMDLFTRYFFEVCDVLKRSYEVNESIKAPRYLQLFALVAFHTFIREKVDLAVIETHYGGEYDATNFIQKPVVTAVTTLGMDHIDQLGPTLREIAWHKSGIFKSGAMAVSAPQDPVVAKVLQERAKEKDTELLFANLDSSTPKSVMQLSPDVQRLNCNVALITANTFLRKLAPSTRNRLMEDDVSQAINQLDWPGRFQRVTDGNKEWFLDVAHNELSIEKAAQWFSEAQMKTLSSINVLIFSHISRHRDGGAVLNRLTKYLHDKGIRMSYVIFSTYKRDNHAGRSHNFSGTLNEDVPIHELWEVYKTTWRKYYPDAEVYQEDTIDGAVQIASDIAVQENGANILVIGSQRLVGGVIQILRPYTSDKCYQGDNNPVP